MVKWLVTHPEAALLAEPGLGKTTATAAALQAMRRAKGARKALVIAPRRVCYEVWTQREGGELARWEDFKDLRVSLLHGDDKDDALEVDADIYVINPDGLAWLTAEGRIESLLKRGVDVLIVDELSKFKHVQTQRFKLIKPYLGRFSRRWGLTGTPASNGLEDIFGQVYVCDLGRALGRYLTHYRHQYFTPGGYGNHTWTPQEGAEERIYDAISSVALALRAKDHLSLPPLVEQNVFVTLDAKSQRVYEGLEKELIAVLEAETVIAANQAVASGKCRQVASGGLYIEPPAGSTTRTTKHLHDAKTEALTEIIDELQGSPLLVVYEFQHDLERIRKALGDVPAINGQTSDKKASQYVADWNAGLLPILCGHPASMGHGLNLQRGGAAHIAWYTLTWDQELYDQTNRRVYRQGNTADRVVIYKIQARGTVDEVVAKALASKERVQSALLDALKIKRKARR